MRSSVQPPHLLRALEAVHAAGVLHRDVKPSNIVLRACGLPALIDFGMASLRGAQPGAITPRLFGTLPHLAPEQLARGWWHLLEEANAENQERILRARTFAVERYSKERLLGDVERLYETLISGHTPRRSVGVEELNHAVESKVG